MEESKQVQGSDASVGKEVRIVAGEKTLAQTFTVETPSVLLVSSLFFPS